MNFYVYRLTHLSERKHYIGSRGCQSLPINDIGTVYFTSSKTVSRLLRQQFSDFKIKIVREFPTRQDALLFEEQYQRRVQAKTNAKFYNLSYANEKFDTTGISFPSPNKGKPNPQLVERNRLHPEWGGPRDMTAFRGENNPAKRPEVRLKLRAARIRNMDVPASKNLITHPEFPVPMSEEHKRKIGLANKGNKRPDLSARNRLGLTKGISKSPEQRYKQSEAAKRRWSNPLFRQQQSNKLKQIYSDKMVAHLILQD